MHLSSLQSFRFSRPIQQSFYPTKSRPQIAEATKTEILRCEGTEGGLGKIFAHERKMISQIAIHP